MHDNSDSNNMIEGRSKGRQNSIRHEENHVITIITTSHAIMPCHYIVDTRLLLN